MHIDTTEDTHIDTANKSTNSKDTGAQRTETGSSHKQAEPTPCLLRAPSPRLSDTRTVLHDRTRATNRQPGALHVRENTTAAARPLSGGETNAAPEKEHGVSFQGKE